MQKYVEAAYIAGWTLCFEYVDIFSLMKST